MSLARKILGRGTEGILSGQQVLFSVAYRQKQGSFGNFRNAVRQGKGRNPSDCRNFFFSLKFHRNGDKGAAPDRENRLSRWG